MKKFILAILLVSSTSFAGLCFNQYKDCYIELENYCKGIAGESNAAKIVKELCSLGANESCYRTVTATLGKEECNRDFKEVMDNQKKDEARQEFNK